MSFIPDNPAAYIRHVLIPNIAAVRWFYQCHPVIARAQDMAEFLDIPVNLLLNRPPTTRRNRIPTYIN